MGHYGTEQERFWAGAFGSDYSSRNRGEYWIASNTSLFAKVLARTERVDSIIEFGANIGLNLAAIRRLLPEAKLSAVEINASAADELRKRSDAVVQVGSMLNWN